MSCAKAIELVCLAIIECFLRHNPCLRQLWIFLDLEGHSLFLHSLHRSRGDRFSFEDNIQKRLPQVKSFLSFPHAHMANKIINERDLHLLLLNKVL